MPASCKQTRLAYAPSSTSIAKHSRRSQPQQHEPQRSPAPTEGFAAPKVATPSPSTSPRPPRHSCYSHTRSTSSPRALVFFPRRRKGSITRSFRRGSQPRCCGAWRRAERLWRREGGSRKARERRRRASRGGRRASCRRGCGSRAAAEVPPDEARWYGRGGRRWRWSWWGWGSVIDPAGVQPGRQSVFKSVKWRSAPRECGHRLRPLE